MAFPSVTAASPGNIKAASFHAVYIKDASTGKYQTLGAIAEGSMMIGDFVTADSLGRNRSNGATSFTAKCKMLQASLVELELLDSICNGTNGFAFKLSDAVALETGGTAALVGWVGVSAAQVGVKARIVADGTPDGTMYIELEWQGSFINSAKDGVVKFVTGDTEFASSSDSATAPYYAIGVYTATSDGGSPALSHIKPCGVSTITLADAAGAAAQTIGPIQNFKLTMDMLATVDGLKRFLPNSLDISVEYDWMQTDAADLLLLDSMVNININAVITMLNGVIFTLNNQVGIQTEFQSVGDMDANRIIRFTHKGKVLQSSLDGIVS